MAQSTPASDAATRRGDIQGLRALAVVLVVIYHTGVGLPGGFIGVDVFFVISGYVITRVLMTELETSGRIDFARFYMRRIRRLLPAMGFMLSVVLVASALFAPLGGQKVASRTGIAAALLNANTYLAKEQAGYFDSAVELNPLLHTWSLSVEEQFYLAFPALLFLLWRVQPARSQSRISVGLGLALVLLASLALSLYLSSGGPVRQPWAFYLAPSRAWEFVAGGLLVLAAPRAKQLTSAGSSILAAVGLVMIVMTALLLTPSVPFPGFSAFLPVAGTAALIVAGEGGPNRDTSMLSARPLQWLGDLSYSLYLWHWPAIVFARALFPDVPRIAVIAALFSFLPAIASYYLVEEPVRHRPAVRRSTIRLATTWIMLPLIAAGSLAVANDMIRDSSTVRQLAFHTDFLRGCDNSTPLGSRIGDDCRWSVADSTGVAFLVGDSTAGHFTEAFVAGASDNGLDAVIATKSACPFVDLLLVSNGEEQDECRDFVRRTTRDLVAMKPTVIVLSSASDGYIESEFTAFRSEEGDDLTNPDEKEESWAQGLARIIETLEESGSEVVVVHPTPKIWNWDPQSCAALYWALAPQTCARSESVAVASEIRSRAVRAESKAVRSSGGTAVDLFDEFCAGGICPALRDGQWVMRDGTHISVGQSEKLAPLFTKILADSLADSRVRSGQVAGGQSFVGP